MDKFLRSPISYRRYFCIVLVLFYILTNSVRINAQIPVLTAEETKQFAERSTNFAIDLLRAVTEDKPSKNVAFSSFSIQICLGVIQLGADNETATDLQRLLPSRSVFSNVLDIYTKNKIFTIVSHVLFSADSDVLSSFNYPVTHYFHSTRDEVNVEHVTWKLFWWFEQEGMPSTRTIFSVFSGEERRVVFANLMNFKNEWLNKFSKTNTHLEDFYINTKKCAQVPMMNQVGLFLYADVPTLNATALTLHFRHYDMSMLILLPDPDTDIYQLQKAVTYDALKEVRSLECYFKVKVKLPKFNVTGPVRYTEALTKMGAEGIFSTNMRIFNHSDTLRVQSMVQDNNFVVAEEGVNQADRATQMDNELPWKLRTREFYANRPFIFFVQNEAGQTFYAGKVDKFD